MAILPLPVPLIAPLLLHTSGCAGAVIDATSCYLRGQWCTGPICAWLLQQNVYTAPLLHRLSWIQIYPDQWGIPGEDGLMTGSWQGQSLAVWPYTSPTRPLCVWMKSDKLTPLWECPIYSQSFLNGLWSKVNQHHEPKLLKWEHAWSI